MKKNNLVALVGEGIDTIFQMIRAFPIEQVTLLSTEDKLQEAKDFEKKLTTFKVPSKIIKLQKYSIDEIFRIVKTLNESEKDREIIINVSSGDKLTSCLALSAAFVNGIKAVGVMNDQLVMMPIMKFSYYKSLSDQKLKILKILYENKKCCASLEQLSKVTKMSLPLISYHMNGSHKVEGLKQMGLVELSENRKNIAVTLSELGRMLMSGYF